VDYKKALKLFQKESNEEGNADSLYMLGKHRTKHCLYLLQRSIIGQMYLMGRGCAKDPRRAYECFLKSSHQDHPKAQFNLGTTRNARILANTYNL
jgi:TPR repeat protein